MKHLRLALGFGHIYTTTFVVGITYLLGMKFDSKIVFRAKFGYHFSGSGYYPPNHLLVERRSTTMTEVKFHYFGGRGSTTAVAVKFFSSISE